VAVTAVTPEPYDMADPSSRRSPTGTLRRGGTSASSGSGLLDDWGICCHYSCAIPQDSLT